MTANAMRRDRTMCIEAGMNDFLPKPISSVAFRAALDKWLRKEDCRPPAAARQPIHSETGESEAIVFDQSGVLERMMDDSELATLVFDTFLADMPLQIEELKIHLEGGQTLLIEARQNSQTNVLVREVKYKGETVTKARIDHAKLVSGGALIFDMFAG